MPVVRGGGMDGRPGLRRTSGMLPRLGHLRSNLGWESGREATEGWDNLSRPSLSARPVGGLRLSFSGPDTLVRSGKAFRSALHSPRKANYTS